MRDTVFRVGDGRFKDLFQRQGAVAFQHGDERIDDAGLGEGKGSVHAGPGGNPFMTPGEVEIGGGGRRRPALTAEGQQVAAGRNRRA